MTDLTIIMMTPNLIPENWARFHKQKLLEAAGGNPIITISKKPLDWGINLIQTGYGFTNIYRQMLRGAKLATTKWIAMADDDTLYPKQHFDFRPTEESFFYNLNRWHMCTWGKPFYFHKPQPGNGLLICSRSLLIKALENRFRSLQEQEDLPSRLCHELGIVKEAQAYDKQGWKPFYTAEPVLSFYHTYCADKLSKKHRKYIWPVRAYDIPLWGNARTIRRQFVEGL